MKRRKDNRGFVALISVIIISAALLIVAASTGLVSFYSRFNMLDAELKERSNAAADACADEAIVQLAQNTDPSGVTISLNSIDQCRIGMVSGGTQKVFEVQATSSKTAVTNLRVAVDGSDFSVVSWQEISDY